MLLMIRQGMLAHSLSKYLKSLSDRRIHACKNPALSLDQAGLMFISNNNYQESLTKAHDLLDGSRICGSLGKDLNLDQAASPLPGGGNLVA